MKKKTGLALSGGGFRAAAFHLGTLRQLHKMGILQQVDVISSISGGSITACAYALNSKSFEEFDATFQRSLQKSMLNACMVLLFVTLLLVLALPFVLAWLGWYWLFVYLPVIALFMRFQFNILPFSRIIEKRYNKVFFNDARLCHLPVKPQLAINATNVETGRPFTFSRDKMADSAYEFPGKGMKPISFKQEQFPVSRAVMASTCVPFAFTPVKIGRKYFKNPDDFHKIAPTLIDGGIYDNQGIHKLTHHGSIYECDWIMVSDAGTKFQPLTKMNNTMMLLMQTSELFMNRIKNVQYISNVVLNKYLGKKSIAYFSLTNEPENAITFFVDFAKAGKIMSSLLEAHELTNEMVSDMSSSQLKEYMKQRINYDEISQRFPNPQSRSRARIVGTNLTPLSTQHINDLASLAEVLTEIHVKIFCPEMCNIQVTS